VPDASATTQAPSATTTTTLEPPLTTAPPEPDAVVIVSITPPLVADWPERDIVFPVVGPVGYVDTWGAYRASIASKFHVGVDIIGVRLQPLVAAVSGTITRYVVDHPTAGWGIVLTGDDGWQYRYYHLNNDAPGTDDGSNPAQWRFRIGLREGDRVRAGELVGYMGDSGDSETSVPHLHFEIRAPDGSPINPYPSVRASAKRTRCAMPDGFGESGLPYPVDTDAVIANVKAFAGEGGYLISSNGTSFPYGSGRTIGSPTHIEIDGPCSTPAKANP
jgi:murein DD-endopeptidase MepM/ murein hydrolase activator NlpD